MHIPSAVLPWLSPPPQESPLRLPVFTALLNLSSANDEPHILQVSHADVEEWLKEWEITPSEKRAFLEPLVDVFFGQDNCTFLCSFISTS